ncbi:hypothetical protein SprV_0802514900 [Sparganum proliferum]
MVFRTSIHLLLLASIFVLIACKDDDEVFKDNLPAYCGHRPKLPTNHGDSGAGKHEAKPYSWPWHVGLYSTSRGKSPYCGATLIAPKWILTAAHCVRRLFDCVPITPGELIDIEQVTGKKLAAVVGDHDYTEKNRYKGRLQVEKLIVHPNTTLDDTQIGYDIALLKLKGRAKRMVHVQFACLPDSFLKLPDGRFCYFAGWGRVVSAAAPGTYYKPTRLMEARVPLASYKECSKRHWKVDGLKHVCTDASFGETCHSDSGGGLHCLDRQGHWVVYGIVSFGTPECDGDFSIFTWTGRYVEWIKKIIRDN